MKMMKHLILTTKTWHVWPKNRRNEGQYKNKAFSKFACAFSLRFCHITFYWKPFKMKRPFHSFLIHPGARSAPGEKQSFLSKPLIKPAVLSEFGMRSTPAIQKSDTRKIRKFTFSGSNWPKRFFYSERFKKICFWWWPELIVETLFREKPSGALFYDSPWPWASWFLLQRFALIGKIYFWGWTEWIVESLFRKSPDRGQR